MFGYVLRVERVAGVPRWHPLAVVLGRGWHTCDACYLAITGQHWRVGPWDRSTVVWSHPFDATVARLCGEACVLTWTREQGYPEPLVPLLVTFPLAPQRSDPTRYAVARRCKR